MVDHPEDIEMYTRVAKHFAERVEAMFATEETLKAAHEQRFSALPFDRTERWNTILRHELDASWKVEGVPGNMVAWDINQILFILSGTLDYNLFTQVLLNLQQPFIRYAGHDAEKVLEGLRAKWEGKAPSPFDPKPKMLKAATAGDLAYNRDLSTVKALKIVAGLTSARSFRVSPKGSTPAFADSENLSMLGIGGDQYLTPPLGCKAYYFCWDEAPQFIFEDEDEPQRFTAALVSYPFVSKSGGATLNAVLFARFIAYLIYRNLPPGSSKALLPRMNSVLLVTNAPPDEVESMKEYVGLPHILRFHEGARPDPDLAPSEAA